MVAVMYVKSASPSYMFFRMGGTFNNDPKTLGMINFLDIRVQFPTSTGSNSWFLTSFNRPVRQFLSENGIPLSGSCCTGPLPPPPNSPPPPPPGHPATGRINGIFVGPNADGVIGAFAADANGRRITGTVVGQGGTPPL